MRWNMFKAPNTIQKMFNSQMITKVWLCSCWWPAVQSKSRKEERKAAVSLADFHIGFVCVKFIRRTKNRRHETAETVNERTEKSKKRKLKKKTNHFLWKERNIWHKALSQAAKKSILNGQITPAKPYQKARVNTLQTFSLSAEKMESLEPSNIYCKMNFYYTRIPFFNIFFTFFLILIKMPLPDEKFYPQVINSTTIHPKIT